MRSVLRIGVIATGLVWGATAHADGDPKKGEIVFKQCHVCHQIGPGAKPMVGPEQNGVVGSVAGSRPGYEYSSAMVEAGKKGLVWTPENLDKFLTKPQAMVPGTKMTFPGLAKAEDRANVIAYLKTFPATTK